MVKYDVIKSRKAGKSIEDVNSWLQSNPGVKIISTNQFVANGFLWTSIFYE